MNIFKRIFRKKNIENPSFKTSEVFKISGVPLHTFVERISLNKRIEEFFTGRDAALLFLGYSKSGKTVYRKKHLEKEGVKIVTFRCNNESTISQLYDQIASETSLGQIIHTYNRKIKISIFVNQNFHFFNKYNKKALHIVKPFSYPLNNV